MAIRMFLPDAVVEKEMDSPSLWGVNLPWALLQVALVFRVHPKHRNEETLVIIRGATI